MGFSAKQLMYNIEYPDEIIHKLHFLYVTEECFGTMQGEQPKGEV